MAIQGPDPIIAALRTRIATDLPAAIAAVNAEADTVADGYTIPDPAQVLDHVPPIEALYDFPTVGIAEGPGAFQDDTGWEATGVYQLHVVCYLQDDDQQALTRRLRRYRRALLRVVLAGRVVPDPDDGPDAAWGVRLLRLEPGRTLGEVAAQQVVSWLSSTALVIEAKRDETTA